MNIKEWFLYNIETLRIKKEQFNIYEYIANRLPKKLVYWCLIRGAAYSTTGEYSNQIVPKLSFFNVLERWHKQHE